MSVNNLNILPFYTSTDDWNHNKHYVPGIYTLITRQDRVLPFQIVRSHLAATPITTANLISYQGGAVVDILALMNGAGLRIDEFPSLGYDLIINPSTIAMAAYLMPPGMYYLHISDGVNDFYSDIFTVVINLDDFLLLRYWHTDNISYNGGHINYETEAYRNYCYLQVNGIGKPEYPFEEEAKNRDGYKFISKQVSYKQYKFEFMAPEYLCDATRIVRMHDYIIIVYQGKVYQVNDVIFTPRWPEKGDLAAVTVEFTTDTVIKVNARGLNGSGGFTFDSDIISFDSTINTFDQI